MTVIKRKRTKTTASAAEEIYALARKHGVTYRPTETDALGDTFARLSDAETTLDESALLLIALERSGHLGKQEAATLHAAHLRAKYE